MAHIPGKSQVGHLSAVAALTVKYGGCYLQAYNLEGGAGEAHTYMIVEVYIVSQPEPSYDVNQIRCRMHEDV